MRIFSAQQRLFPSQEPSREVIHHEAFEGKREKAQVPEDRHFENFLPLHDREDVIPFGGGPEIPEFPKPAAHPARHEKRKETPHAPGRQISFERGKSQTEIYGIEQKDEADPHRPEKERAQRQGQNDGHDQKNRAGNHEGVFGAARENNGTNRFFPPAERFDEVGAQENSRPDRRKSPAVSEPAHRER